MKTVDSKVLFSAAIITIDVLLGASNYMAYSNILVIIALLIGIIIIIRGTKISDLYLFTSLIPFFSSIKISDKSLEFLLLVLASAKIVFGTNTAKKKSIKYLFMGILMLSILLFNDLYYGQFAEVFIYASYVIYVLVVINFVNFKDYDEVYAAELMLIAFFIAQISVFIEQGGDVQKFIVQSYAAEYRLGESDEGKNQLGGAMGFPIYSIMIINLTIKLFQTRISVYRKMLYTIISSITFLVAFLSISRVYLLGLAALMGCILIYLSMNLRKSTLFVFMLFVIIVVLFFKFVNNNVLDSVTEQYSVRIDNYKKGEDRIAIYKDCIEYISNDYYCLLFGRGTFGYREIGKENNLQFRMSAHNIILDGFLTYGILGLSFIVFLYFYLYRKKSIYDINRPTMIDLSCFICYIFMCMTNSPFILGKSYIQWVFLTLNCSNNYKGGFSSISGIKYIKKNSTLKSDLD